jgi:phage terminase large subunit-like protein
LVASASLDLASPVSLMRSLGLEPSPAQATFLSSAGPRACFSGGRGAGKTTAGLVLALHMALATPSRRVLVVAPTVRDAADLFGRMVDWVLAVGGDCQASRMRLVMHFPNGSTAWFLCATRGPEWFRGLFYDLVVVDQAEKVPADVKEALAGILRPGSRLAALEDV